jgi:hypothetical protein
MLSPFSGVTGGIIAPWFQTARPAIASKLLYLLALVLRLRLMCSKLFDCSQIITAQQLDGGLQLTSQESVWFSPEVSLLACKPRNDTRMTNMTNHNPMR